jgi:hypothetical protein
MFANNLWFSRVLTRPMDYRHARNDDSAESADRTITGQAGQSDVEEARQ